MKIILIGMICLLASCSSYYGCRCDACRCTYKTYSSQCGAPTCTYNTKELDGL